MRFEVFMVVMVTSALKMETVLFSEMLASTNQSTPSFVPSHLSSLSVSVFNSFQLLQMTLH
jgi:hypothetical protein